MAELGASRRSKGTTRAPQRRGSGATPVARPSSGVLTPVVEERAADDGASTGDGSVLTELGGAQSVTHESSKAIEARIRLKEIEAEQIVLQQQLVEARAREGLPPVA